MSAPQPISTPARRWPLLVAAFVVFCILIGLGTWQVQRMYWKEDLLAQINERVTQAPAPLKKIEMLQAETRDVDYWPVALSGEFLHAGERHFFATWDGQTGYYIYTPLKLADGRFVFVNRGFIPYELKDPAKRPQGEVSGPVTITGLARNELTEKPGWVVPENDLAKNVFYWKDIRAMAQTAGLPDGAIVLPFFVDADKTPNPGGLPVGGVTMIDLPNNHLQYVLTWYGLAAALVAVVAVMLGRKPADEAGEQ